MSNLADVPEEGVATDLRWNELPNRLTQLEAEVARTAQSVVSLRDRVSKLGANVAASAETAAAHRTIAAEHRRALEALAADHEAALRVQAAAHADALRDLAAAQAELLRTELLGFRLALGATMRQAATAAAAELGEALAEQASVVRIAVTDELRRELGALAEKLEPARAVADGLKGVRARLDGLAAKVEEVIVTALPAALAEAVNAQVATTLAQTASGALSEAVNTAELATTVGSALADAVNKAVGDLAAAAASSDQAVRATIITALAATLDDFGRRIDRDFDALAARLERLWASTERPVTSPRPPDTVVSSATPVALPPSSAEVREKVAAEVADRLTRLRQVAAGVSDAIRAQGRGRRGRT